MARRLAVGDEAPNFDLSSTEGVLLMLCDEVPRNLVLLYFFDDPESELTKSDLAVLARARDDLATRRVNVLGIAPAKMPALKALQAELALPFPLLRDDRGFSAAYGVGVAGDGEDDEASRPALVLVGRDQSVRWIANPVETLEAALAEVTKVADSDGSPTGNYPRKVINRLVDRWVN